MKRLLSLCVGLFISIAVFSQIITHVVCNVPGYPNAFTDLQAAIYSSAVKPGDVLLVQGSTTTYGDIVLNKRLIIMGPGYFLNENTETQTSTLSALINTLNIQAAAEGSIIQGLVVNGSKPRDVNIGYGGGCNGNAVSDFGSYTVEINSGRITLMSNLISGNLIVNKSSYNQIRQNYLGQVATTDTSYFNSFTNNIINGVVQDYNSSFQNNSIGGSCAYHYFNNSNLTGNIIGACFNAEYCGDYRIHIVGGITSSNIFNFPVGENSPDYSEPDFSKVFQYTGSTDGKYLPKPNGLAAIKGIGPFAGPTPYKLSGICLHPNIYSVTMPNTSTSGSGLKIEVKVRAND